MTVSIPYPDPRELFPQLTLASVANHGGRVPAAGTANKRSAPGIMAQNGEWRRAVR